MSLPKVLHLVSAKARVQIQVLKTLQSVHAQHLALVLMYMQNIRKLLLDRSEFLKVYVTCVSRDFMLLFHALRQPQVPYIFMKTLPF